MPSSKKNTSKRTIKSTMSMEQKYWKADLKEEKKHIKKESAGKKTAVDKHMERLEAEVAQLKGSLIAKQEAPEVKPKPAPIPQQEHNSDVETIRVEQAQSIRARSRPSPTTRSSGSIRT
jgi:hypothetical protein